MLFPSPHSVSVNDLLARLTSGIAQGLNQGEREKRLKEFGPNLLPKPDQDGPFRIFLRQFQNPIVYVLIGAGVLALTLGKGVDSLVVFGVVIINGIIGFLQEFKAGKALDALSAMVPQRATVLTEGEIREVDGASLVPGDIVLLKSGDKVPADLRLAEVKNLKVEEAALTGESVAVEKSCAVVREDAPLGDRSSMAFSGTLVTYGTAKGLVIGTGGSTELGKISRLLGSATQIDTPLTQSLAVFGKWLTVAITLVAMALFAIGWWRGFPLGDALLAAITLAVAAIPEGLPAIVTITLAIGVRRMAARRAVIRKLPAVETLGSASIVCSDKTGTLTKNEMTVQRLWTPHRELKVEGVGYSIKGRFLDLSDQPVALSGEERQLLLSGAACNDSQLVDQQGVLGVQGDPTEGALLVAYGKAKEEIGSSHLPIRIDSQPFESELQYMATLHDQEGKRFVYLKGAPEVVFAKCVDAGLSVKAKAAVEKFAQEGMRVLAFAKKEVVASQISHEEVRHGFSLLGLQAMIDPPREEVIRSISNCHRAGISVKMITGDHKTTAKAIAKQIGIDNGEPAFTGEELGALSDSELRRVAMKSNVFARVTPEQKLRLVQAIQAEGAVCSMTGDGVNDAPALKQANIGVAMGITGTSVSKEAADLVLTDDNFTSIEAAVEEGRRIYDNLVKSLAFVLPTNLGEALIILFAVLTFPMVAGELLMPILPVQILWINLVATVALALPLAFESPEANIMSRPPRHPKAPILNGFVIWRTFMVAALMAVGAIGLFLYEYRSEIAMGVAHELAIKEAQTMAVTTVIFFQIFYLFNCRSLTNSMFSVGLWSNRSVYLGISVLILLQVAFVEFSVMNQLFSSAPLSWESWIKSALVGLIVVPVVAVEKAIRRRNSTP
jgi:magnesium-transporting ATPase (P-type)